MTGNNITQQTIFNYLNEKILPHVNNGVIQSKAYIMDLIHRSVHYLIIHDTISLIVSLLFLIASIWGIIWVLKKVNNTQYGDSLFSEDVAYALFLFLLIIFVASLIVTYNDILNLIQDFMVPELRLYYMYLWVH